MRRQFSINQSSAFVGFVGCCRRYRAMASGGSRRRGISLLQGRALTITRKRRMNVGGLSFGLASAMALPRHKTTRMTIQTKETRNDHDACWTAVEDCNLPGAG